MGFEKLKGLTLTEVRGLEKDSEEVFLTTTEGKKFKMYHPQDCCERVRVEEIVGDVEDILNTPILLAEESTQKGPDGEWGDTSTWTFYRMQTIKGPLVIRWLGESNGYYGEQACFEEV